ncbi:hypothetical protein F4604DRAFT_1931750 [Suillus subluteus]|nr:hypothetical protein F4604DRAFT_1931750 [Suillus subluteus]
MTSAFPSNTFLVAPPNSKTSLFTDEEYMPSLMPSRPFESNPAPAYSKLDDVRVEHRKEDVNMFNLSSPPPVSKEGSIPYRGLARVDGRTIITFKKLTRPEAEEYLTTENAKYNDYHSVYILNIVHVIESFCFCQDELIANDWDTHMFRDSSYSGHPVIPGGIKLPTGGPRLDGPGKNASENSETTTHTLVTSSISSKQSFQLTCLRKPPTTPKLSKSEAKHLNSYTAVAKAHREPELASKILDALLMPFPDEDTIYALMDSRLLNVGNTQDILHFAHE